MSDLPGPEKPVNGIDWSALVAKEVGPNTPSRALYSPAKVRPRHRIAVLLHETGWKAKDIARALGYTEARVSVILNSHHTGLQDIRAKFAAQVADHALDTQSRIKLYANEMLDVLVRHARNEKDAANSRLAARDILYMAGFTPVKKELVAHTNIPVEDLKRLVGQIGDANEVVMKADQWRVKDPAA